jgi:hypothetical protein
MGISVKNTGRKSDSYVGTFSIECADDMLQLEELKAMVRNMNTMLKDSGFGQYQYRVCLRGRKPIKKEVCPPGYYTPGSRGPVSYNYFGNIVGGIANASKYDAYIYRR